MSYLFKANRLDTEEEVLGDLVHSALTAESRTVPVGIKPDGCYPVEVDPATVELIEAPVLDDVKRLRALLKWFCDRVDKGEVRSRKTYQAFKEALEENR